MEKFEKTLLARTHFWKTFMTRGQPKCIVKIQNKDEEDKFVPPIHFSQSFQELGVATGSKISLIELKNYVNYEDEEGGEGGEDENEEMDPEEVAEQSDENPDDQPQYEKVEEPEQDQKASDVLFQNDDVAKAAEPKQS